MRPDVLSGTFRADLLDALVLLAGLVWLSAGLAKTWRPLARADIEALLPGGGRWLPGMRVVVPCGEVVLGLSLVTGTGARGAGFAGAAAAAVFAVLHVAAMVRAALADQPLSPGCGCFGRPAVTVAAAPGPVTFDSAAATARSWSVALAAVLAMLSWLATLPCQVCA